MIEFTYKLSPVLAVAGLFGVGLLLWWSYLKGKGRPGGVFRSTLIILRIVIIAGVVLCLLDPQRVESRNQQEQSRIAVLLDTSRSMSVQDGASSRLSEAKEWVKQEVLPIVPSAITLSIRQFSEDVRPLPTIDSANPTGNRTALSLALEQTLMEPADLPLTSVIIISDGIENTGAGTRQVGKLFRRKGVPIHTVTSGSTNEMRDVILENVHVRRAVPNESPTRVTVTLRAPGLKGEVVPVQILDGKSLVASKDVTLSGTPQKIEIEITPREKGFRHYNVSVPPLEGEWLSANNRRRFGMEVVDPIVRVIYMEGTPQQPSTPVPEWKYLKDALESDPNIRVTTLYRRSGENRPAQSDDLEINDAHRIYPVEHPTRGFPRTLEGLLKYDAVIHSDIKKDSFSGEQLQNIARLVEEHGGGFLMIGGNSAFGKGGYHRTILDRIIPVAMERENDSQARTVQLRALPGTFLHPVMNIGRSAKETEEIWTAKFPRLYGYNRVDHAKPGATVLAENPGYRNEFGPGVLLAVQEIGKGRSMAFTSDTTRSWGRDFETIWGEPTRKGSPLTEANCDSRYYRKFWVNAIRWLASGKMGRTNSPVTLELAENYCAPGQKVTARVNVRDSGLNDVPNAEVSLLLSSGPVTNPPVFARYDAAARAYVATLAAGSTGDFIIRAIARNKTSKIGEDRQLLVSEEVDLELADVRARPDFMAALARQTKGEAILLGKHDIPVLSRVFSATPPPSVEQERHPFWDKPVFLAAFLGMLALEWALRRVWGLA